MPVSIKGLHMAQPRRTKHFIDSNVQGALARRIIIHWVAFLGVACFLSFVLQVLSNPFDSLSSHFNGMWLTHGPFLIVMVFLLPVFILDSIKLSHRFAGPIFALRRAIREVAAGEAPRKLKFRRRDFWQDLALDYNAMLTQVGAFEGQEEQEQTTEDKELAASSK